jgi:hypothetical protein
MAAAVADTEIEVRRSSEEFAKAVVAAALVITEEAASAKRDSEEFKALAAEAAEAAKAELSLARDAALEAQQMYSRWRTGWRRACENCAWLPWIWGSHSAAAVMTMTATKTLMTTLLVLGSVVEVAEDGRR